MNETKVLFAKLADRFLKVGASTAILVSLSWGSLGVDAQTVPQPLTATFHGTIGQPIFDSRCGSVGVRIVATGTVNVISGPATLDETHCLDPNSPLAFVNGIFTITSNNDPRDSITGTYSGVSAPTNQPLVFHFEDAPFSILGGTGRFASASGGSGLGAGDYDLSTRGIDSSLAGEIILGYQSAGWILFSSDRDGNSEIYSMNADGSGQTRLTATPESEGGAKWSPSGQKILYAKTVDANTRQIWVMRRDGSSKTLVSDAAGYRRDFSWSPDGRKILFASGSSSTASDFEIWVMDADGANKTQLTDTALNDHAPAWSPNGSKIAFGRCVDITCDVFTMNADGSQQTDLTGDYAMDDDVPQFTPDGEKLIFGRQTSAEGYNFFVMNVDGTGAQPLTNAVESAAFIAAYPAPNGSKIGLTGRTSFSAASLDVYSAGSDGTGLVNLTNNSVLDQFGVWSPDSSTIAFTSRRDTSTNEIYTMSADGTGVTRLTTNTATDTVTDWTALPADLSAPIVSIQSLPIPNPAGWSQSDVTLAISGVDIGSGMDELSYTLAGAQTGSAAAGDGSRIFISITAEGQTTLTVTATDLAGNQTVRSTVIKIDKTSPSLSCGSADGAWHANDVTIQCTAVDTVSGVNPAADASFGLSTSVPVETQTDNAATGSRTVCDVAGNCSGAGPISGNKIDKRAPSIEIVTPAEGSEFAINSVVRANYQCAEIGPGSGAVSCAGTVPNGALVDTRVAGKRTFTVSTRDAVGNTRTAAVTYYAKAQPTTFLYSSVNPSSYGQTVTLTARVREGGFYLGRVPNGTVQFLDGAAVIGTASVVDGDAVLALPALEVGSHNLTAVYLPNDIYFSSTSSPLTQTVNIAKTTLKITSSVNPSNYLQTVTFTAQVTAPGSVPPGTVYLGFKDKSGHTGGCGPLSLGSDGKASCAVKFLIAGQWTITAQYVGNGVHYTNSQGVMVQTVKSR